MKKWFLIGALLLSIGLIEKTYASNGDPVKEKQKTFKPCKSGTCFFSEAARNRALNNAVHAAGNCFLGDEWWEEMPCADCFPSYCYSITVAQNCTPNNIIEEDKNAVAPGSAINKNTWLKTDAVKIAIMKE